MSLSAQMLTLADLSPDLIRQFNQSGLHLFHRNNSFDFLRYNLHMANDLASPGVAGVPATTYPCWLPENVTYAEHVHNRFTFYSSGITMTLIFIVGIIANLAVVSCFVCQRRNHRSPIHIYMISLSLWDCSLLFNGWFLMSLAVLRHHGPIVGWGSWVYVYPYSYTAINISMTGCIWITVTMTLERYLSISHPLWHSTLDRQTRARNTLLAVSTVAVLFNIPRCLEIRITECLHQHTGRVHPSIFTSEIHQNYYYFTIYRICGVLGFVSVGPFALLTILTLLIKYKLVKAETARLDLQGSNDKSTRSCSNASSVIAHKTNSDPKKAGPAGKRTSRHTLIILSPPSVTETSMSAYGGVETSFAQTSFNDCSSNCQQQSGCQSPVVNHHRGGRLGSVTSVIKRDSSVPLLPSSRERHSKATVGCGRNCRKSSKPPTPGGSIATSASITASQRRHLRQTAASLNRMMLSVLVKFLLCYTLCAANDILEYVVGDEQFQTSLVSAYMVDVSNVLILLHSATTPIFYFVYYRRLRHQLLLALTCWTRTDATGTQPPGTDFPTTGYRSSHNAAN